MKYLIIIAIIAISIYMTIRSLSIIPLSTTTIIVNTIYFEVSKTYRPAISPLCILS
jgi:hypothetical protein